MLLSVLISSRMIIQASCDLRMNGRMSRQGNVDIKHYSIVTHTI